MSTFRARPALAVPLQERTGAGVSWGAMGMAKKEIEAPILAAAVAEVVVTTAVAVGVAAAGAAASA